MSFEPTATAPSPTFAPAGAGTFAPPQLPKLNYSQVLNLYDANKSQPEFAGKTMDEFAASLNDATGNTGMFDEGLHPSAIRNFDLRATRMFEDTGIPNVAADAMGAVGSVIGKEDAFRTAGFGLPRAIINMAPMIAGAALAGETGGASLAPFLGTGTTAALSASDTYAQTGSPAQAALSAGTAAIMPTVAHAVGGLGLRLAGAELTDATGKLIGENLAQRAAGYGASQVGAFGLMEAQHQASSLMSGNGLDLSGDHLINNLIGQLPFLAMDAGTGFLAGSGSAQARVNAAKADLVTRGVAGDANAQASQAYSDYLSGINNANLSAAAANPPPATPAVGAPIDTVSVPEVEPFRSPSYPYSPAMGGPITGPSVEQPTREPTSIGAAAVPPDQTLFGQPIAPAVQGSRDYPLATPIRIGDAPIVPLRPLPQVLGKPLSFAPVEDSAPAVDVTKLPQLEATPTDVVAPPPTPDDDKSQVQAFDTGVATPKPVSPAVEQQVQALVAEPDLQKAVTQIKQTYEKVLKPTYGLQDNTLDTLSDAGLKQMVTDNVAKGATLDDATAQATQAVKNQLEAATTAAKSRIIDDNIKAKWANLKKSIGGQTNVFVDPTKLVQLIDIGYHIAKNLMVNGAMKLQDWRDRFLSEATENGFDIDDATLKRVELGMKSQIGTGDDRNDVVLSKKRQQLEGAMANLNQLNVGWDSLGKAGQAATGERKSPLDKVTTWRDDILKANNDRYSKYAEVDENILNAAGNLHWANGHWTDGTNLLNDKSAKSYLQRAADFAYKAAVKKEKGGEEVVETHQTPNEARERAAALNRDRTPAEQETHSYVTQEPVKGPYSVVKRYNKTSSLDAGFEANKHGAEDEGATDVPAGETETSPIQLDENGEPVEVGGLEHEGLRVGVDPVEPADEMLRTTKQEVDDRDVHDVFKQHLADQFTKMIDRLDPLDRTLDRMGVNKKGEFVARAKVVLAQIRDSRFGVGDGENINWAEVVKDADEKIVNPDWRFTATDKLSAEKVANNWYNGSGKKNLYNWLAQQPEMQAIRRSITPIDPKSVASIPLKEFPVTLDAVQGARTSAGTVQSVNQFARALFARTGLTAPVAQLHADAVERLTRVAAVFKAATKATVALADLPIDTLGAALDLQQAGEWKPLILLSKDATTSHMMALGLGHEAFHILEQSATKGFMSPAELQVMNQMADTVNQMDPAQRTQLMQEAVNSLGPDAVKALQSDPNLAGVLQYSAADPRETLATMAGVYSLGVAESPRNLVADMVYGDGAVQRFMSAIGRTVSRVASAFRGVFAGGRAGLVEDRGVTKPFADMVAELNKGFDQLARSSSEISDAIKTLGFVDAGRPENILSSIVNRFTPDFSDVRTGDAQIDDGLQAAFLRVNPKEKVPGGFEEFFSDFHQLADMYPTLKPIAHEALGFIGAAKSAAQDAMSVFFTRDIATGKVVLGEPAKELQKVGSSVQMRKALTDQSLSEQLLKRLLTPDEIKLMATKHGLTPDQAKSVAVVRGAIANANQVISKQMIRQNRSQVVHTIARMFMTDKVTKSQTALDAAEAYTGAALAKLGGDPLPPGVNPDQVIAGLQAEYGILPQKLQSVAMSSGDLLQQHLGVAQLLSSRPWFMTEQRWGRFAASYNVAGSTIPGRLSGDSMKELEKEIAVAQRDPKNTNFQRYDNSAGPLMGLSADVVRAFQDMGDVAYTKTAAMFQSPIEQNAAREAFSSLAQSVDKELAARGLGKFLVQRKHSPGREYIDMLENSMRYISTVPYALSKGYFRSRGDVVLADPDYIQNPAAQRISRQQMDNILAPESALGSKIRSWAFMYYQGANLASALTELVQPMLTVPASFTAEGASVSKGYAHVLSGFKQVAGAYATGKFSDPRMLPLLTQLEHNGMLEAQTTGYFFNHGDSNAINLSKLTEGSLPEKASAFVGNAAGQVSSVMRSFYGHFAGLSSRVIAVAAADRAFDLVKQGKLDPEGVYDYVRNKLVLNSPGTAGKTGRPAGLYNGQWMNRTGVGLLSIMQQFTITMTSMFSRMAKQAVQSGSITSGESKAFMQLAVTQLLAAGALGLPGIGTAINVANAAFPTLNIKSNLKEKVAGLAGSDSALGKTFSDIFMRGLPSALGGIDMSSRLGLSDMLGVSSYDGFQMSALFGVPGDMLSTLNSAKNSAMTGHYAQATEDLVPTSIRNILRLYRTGGNVQDSSGRTLYQPTTGEKFAMSVGFTPNNVAALREYRQLASQQDDSTKSDLQQFNRAVSDHILAKDFAGARAMLLQRQAANPIDFSAAEGLKAAVQLTQDRSMPEDPRRGGGRLDATERGALLQTYGISGPAPSEVARTIQGHQIESAMGLASVLDPSDIQRAAMIDHLLATNPQLTRASARVYVERMTQHSATAFTPGSLPTLQPQ